MSLSPSRKNPELTAKIQCLEEKFAVLQNEQLGEFRWPLASLPDTARVDDVVRIQVNLDQLAAHVAIDTKNDELENRRRLLEELIN